MSDNYFRRRPYLERRIDTWKAVVLAIVFVIVIGRLASYYWG